MAEIEEPELINVLFILKLLQNWCNDRECKGKVIADDIRLAVQQNKVPLYIKWSEQGNHVHYLIPKGMI